MGMMIKEAKHIPEILFLTAVKQTAGGGWKTRWDVQEKLEELLDVRIPEKVFLAKARKLIRSDKIHGCECGCRGDYHVPLDNSFCCGRLIS